MTRKLFVYGALCNGMVHFSKIQQHVVSVENAVIHGAAFMLKIGYPVVIVSEIDAQNRDIIPGQILEIQGSELLGHLLDEFHGCSLLRPEKGLHFRKQILAYPRQMADGVKATECDVYSLNPSKLPKDAIYIEGGNWQTHFSIDKTLPEQLTERQKQYVQKLGSTAGRDIVPIDLPLYRELMNLGLIVDKGRRVALSSLGKEIFRYL